ncbi:16S rRNA (cytosine(1402)-N(4))-methyltransferase RsmH [Enterobacteriaceae endosymbiont of Neohaemonia nigricornis]|uniref:16S rRNA (cytosine(1402)-N(4))-methyltransferase RsmH n=1 Tax=Enterobacteriaceae endosymbiont of Neohaemonia nigricornis TaxID=2675792 RepID=UPI001449AE87|nr:16S rRNA (cytosine(1402)-N(4))-methyltransferase RsmH [Enterobacteriaceae endosymbiont of Neohaemonia nigricornis]QJC30338.1 16S rRNA (cytosine(1402)-N(4))-methyltransferase RsmH [Enterobacteriaceae endosymbiont of Neohaemonia nigricornis]
MIHIPVLLKEAIKNLNIKHNGIYIDATYGCGGHTYAILQKLGPLGKVYAIDRDNCTIIQNKIHDKRIIYIYDNFSNLQNICCKYNILGKVDGILFDLGLSSFQLNNPDRGFSFMLNGPLDMRMNQKDNITAYTFLKNINQDKLSHILKIYGEERFHKKIAIKIKKYISFNNLNSTHDLSNIIRSTIFLNKKYNKHPATRTFQAIRIVINNELEELKQALYHTLKILKIGGILSVISFHSLEDRIVKKFMTKYSKINDDFLKIPFNILEINNFNNIKYIKLKIINRVFPNKDEIFLNPRSRSAILRIAQRV